MKVKSLSVFFPCFNEGGNIEGTVEGAVAVLKKETFPWEIIIIDDGSLDKTLVVAQKLSKKYENVKTIHQENGGYGLALRQGFSQSRNEWVVYTDADGQFDFSQIQQFLDLPNETDAIWGFRKKRNEGIFRVGLAKIWGMSVFFLFGLGLRDLDCGFKMIKKSVIDSVSPLESKRGAMINAELAIKIKRSGYNLLEIGVDHYPRKSGQPTGSSLVVACQSYMDLFKLWKKLNFQK